MMLLQIFVMLLQTWLFVKHRKYSWSIANIHNNIINTWNFKIILWNFVIISWIITIISLIFVILWNVVIISWLFTINIPNICDNGMICSVEMLYVLTVSKTIIQFLLIISTHYVISIDHVHPLYHIYKQLLIGKEYGTLYNS